ncbi:MAG: hypothetical protein IPO37_05845 [Saprospiraceae bacterium]|nr:hypothetical protein [Saprospiraceae bacterium]
MMELDLSINFAAVFEFAVYEGVDVDFCHILTDTNYHFAYKPLAEVSVKYKLRFH